MADASDWSAAGSWLRSIAEPIKDVLLSAEVGAAVGGAVGGEAGAKVGASVLGGIGDRTKPAAIPERDYVNERLPAGKALVVPVSGIEQSVVILGPAELTYIPLRSEFRQIAAEEPVLREGSRTFDLLTGETRRERYSGK